MKLIYFGESDVDSDSVKVTKSPGFLVAAGSKPSNEKARPKRISDELLHSLFRFDDLFGFDNRSNQLSYYPLRTRSRDITTTSHAIVDLNLWYYALNYYQVGGSCCTASL